MALEYGMQANLAVPAADAVTNTNMRDVVGNKTDAAVTAPAADKSITGYVKGILTNIAAITPSKLYLTGACDTGMGASTTVVVCDDLAGYGNDYFNNKYFMTVLLNANSVGNAPERELRQITDYVSATGTFTVSAFSANVEASDSIAVMHEGLAGLDPGLTEVSDVGTTTGIIAYIKSLIQELDQRKVAKLATATLTSVNGAADTTYANIVNITDKGVLTGISQQLDGQGTIPVKSGKMKLIIDGTTVYDGTFTSVSDTTILQNVSNSVSFNHRYNTSLQVQHCFTNTLANGCTCFTSVAYTVDD